MVNVGGGSSGVPFNVGAGAVGFHYLWFYSIWFLGQDISWDNVLSPAPVAIFIYVNLPFFSLTKVFYILFMYIFFMFILMKLITCNEFHKVNVNSVWHNRD